ncbi:MAG: hypothetical protein ACOX7D_03695 [Alphaproteobacteria bacterium]|jgi:hypothetical protein
MVFKEELSPAEKLFRQIDKVVIVRGRLSTDPTVWEFHIAGKVLKIEACDLEDVKNFRNQYIKVFETPAPLIKKASWINLLANLTDKENNKIEHQEAPEESSDEFIARQIFEIICEREISEDAEDAETGMCLYRHISKKDGKEYFSIPSTAFKNIVDGAGFKIPLNKLSVIMTELKMKRPSTPKVWYNGKERRSWCFIPEAVLEERGDLQRKTDQTYIE